MSHRKNLRLTVATATAVALTGGLLALAPGAATAAPEPAKAAKAAKHADFNGDGISDFATPDYPNIVIRHGVKGGDAGKPKKINQNSPGIPGKVAKSDAEDDDTFGDATASADLNQDGYADLVVSDSSETVGKQKAHGMVVVLWGSKQGVGSKATLLPPNKSRAEGYFGLSLATGDFDGDGKSDIAVGDFDSVHIYRGPFSSTTGKPTGAVTQHRPAGGKKIIPIRLIAGNVTQDKATDLYALGLAGLGKEPRSATWFLQGGKSVKSGAYSKASGEPNFWVDAVVADFDKDGYGDLAVGESQYKEYTGSVKVLRGTAKGPGTSYRFTQDTAGIATGAGMDDRFGANISAGDIDKDGYPDLAVSAPGEKVGKADEAGGVHILRGGKKGLTGTGSQWFTKDTAGVPGKASEWDAFGENIGLRDVDSDGDADLYAGSYVEQKSVLIGGGKKGLDLKSARSVNVPADFLE
ncbi:FG-GAP and VCBS repeat-containing protein [Streptomyces sp. NPDC000594]|uniref:FG-GAP and VCBS repeat-containing protein n=1 Tax=Streptomyces sp. NPDC000594 TaxID=3154261 RepID=UPI0033216E2C